MGVSQIAQGIYTENKKYTNTSKVSEEKEKAIDETKRSGSENKSEVYGEAAILEKSNRNKVEQPVDRSKLISQLKAEAESRMQQLRSLVEKMMTKQGGVCKIATFDDAIDRIKNGEVEVDEDTRLQAKKDIAEDGYWGVEQTSERLFSFAKALAGEDKGKIDSMVDAFKKGYEQAKKKWGGELPEICQKTYDAFLEKVDAWKNEENKETEQ